MDLEAYDPGLGTDVQHSHSGFGKVQRSTYQQTTFRNNHMPSPFAKRAFQYEHSKLSEQKD